VSNFGDCVKAHRLESGLSLDAIARLSGLSKSYIWEIEQGKKKCGSPSIETIARLSHAFGVAPKSLLNAAYDDWLTNMPSLREVVIKKMVVLSAIGK
jgi:transcriptional regulator with XRE-family HTH domain